MEGHKITAGVVFSAIGGAIVLIQGVYILLLGEDIIFLELESELRPAVPIGFGTELIGIFAIIVGFCILGGAFLVSTADVPVIGGMVVLIFSVVSLFVGGGWLLGLVFAAIGGILGLFRK
jgi:hypothetical protein